MTSFGSFNQGNSLAIQSDGKILIGGSSAIFDDNHFSVVLVRYNGPTNEGIITLVIIRQILEFSRTHLCLLQRLCLTLNYLMEP